MRKIRIIGGGVAGLSLGVALNSRGVKVELHEASSYPRHRLCGEFINGVSEATLESLGIADLFADAKIHQEMKWWFRDELLLEGELKNPVKALSRWAMDERLKERFLSTGGNLAERSRFRGEESEGVVWATGRVHDQGSRWIGLKMHFHDVQLLSGLEMHLGEGGYVGLTEIEEGKVNLCGLFERKPGVGGAKKDRILNYLRGCGLEQLSDRVQGWNEDERSFCGVSGVRFGKQQASNRNRFALGDAERIIPPFTGNGMSMAMEAAEVAIEPLVQWNGAEKEWAQACDDASEALHQRFRQRVTLARGLQSAIMDPLGKDLVSALCRVGWLPVNQLNRYLTSCI